MTIGLSIFKFEWNPRENVKSSLTNLMRIARLQFYNIFKAVIAIVYLILVKVEVEINQMYFPQTNTLFNMVLVSCRQV